MKPNSTPKPLVDGAGYDLAQQKLASCSRVVGEAFFPVMVEALAHVLSVRWVLLCTIDPFNRGKARTIAVWDNGPGENFEYDLEHTPCANIVAQGPCRYPDSITHLFPRDVTLREMGAECYVGAPLRSASGEVLGLLAVLDSKPMKRIEMASEIVEVFAGRAAAELERLATASINERLGRIVEDSVSEVYIFDAETYKFKLVNRGARENLGYTMEELRQLTPWDLKPEFTAEEFARMVEPLRSGGKPHLLFETLHKRKDGTVYEVAVQLQLIRGVENVFYASITDITERKRAEEARAHLAAIVASSSEAIISQTMDGTIKSWNGGAEQIFGYTADEMIGTSIRRLVPADRQDEEENFLIRIQGGERIRNCETVRVCRDGRHVNVSVTISPIFDSAGTIVGASKIAHDISERKRAEERERLLVREVNHRAKNLLSLVQAIARQTAVGDPKVFVQRFGDRIKALAASQDVLVHSGWQDVPLEALVCSQLGHFRDTIGRRIHQSGPELKVTAAAAQAIGMALHELATNAVKYGALSNDSGTVVITWNLVANSGTDQRFELSWKESGGPTVTKPSHRGFGSTVIDGMLKFSVNGEIDLDYAPGGLVWRFTCPAHKVLQSSDRQVQRSNPGSTPLSPQFNRSGRSVLVVEDDALIALEVAEILRDAGFEVLGPASSVAQSLALLSGGACDAAVLDINLGSETAEPIAELLTDAGIPFLTLSSYGLAQRPATFAGAPHLDKPVRSDSLIRKLRECLEADVSSGRSGPALISSSGPTRMLV